MGVQPGGGPSAAVSALAALPPPPWLRQALTGGGQAARVRDRQLTHMGRWDGVWGSPPHSESWGKEGELDTRRSRRRGHLEGRGGQSSEGSLGAQVLYPLTVWGRGDMWRGQCPPALPRPPPQAWAPSPIPLPLPLGFFHTLSLAWDFQESGASFACLLMLGLS